MHHSDKNAQGKYFTKTTKTIKKMSLHFPCKINSFKFFEAIKHCFIEGMYVKTFELIFSGDYS